MNDVREEVHLGAMDRLRREEVVYLEAHAVAQRRGERRLALVGRVRQILHDEAEPRVLGREPDADVAVAAADVDDGAAGCEACPRVRPSDQRDGPRARARDVDHGAGELPPPLRMLLQVQVHGLVGVVGEAVRRVEGLRGPGPFFERFVDF